MSYLRHDPITGRFICKYCWDGMHGTKKKPECNLSGCQCGCKDVRAQRRRVGAAHTAARRERKTLERKQLEATDNPLQAVNSRYREPGAAKEAARQDPNPAQPQGRTA
jgi:hypothetical protein